MNTQQLRQLMNLCEARNPDVEYHDTDTQVTANLVSYSSQSYTKLAQNFKRIEEMEAEIKALREENKTLTKEAIEDLFDIEDVIKTCVVRTKSFIFTLSKIPKVTESPKYKDILEELAVHLTPELLDKLAALKKTLVTLTQKARSLKIEPLKEGLFSSFLDRLKNYFKNWGNSYNKKLKNLEQLAFSK